MSINVYGRRVVAFDAARHAAKTAQIEALPMQRDFELTASDDTWRITTK